MMIFIHLAKFLTSLIHFGYSLNVFNATALKDLFRLSLLLYHPRDPKL